MGTVTTLMPLWKSYAGGTWTKKNALLYDTFTTPEAAPITSPRTCEPGPGTLTIVDTGNNFAITSEGLVATGLASVGDPGFSADLSGNVISRVSGLAVYGSYRQATGGRIQLALDAALDTTPTLACVYDDVPIVAAFSGGVSAAPYRTSVNTVYKTVVIVRPSGVFFVLDGELVWADDTGGDVLDTALWQLRSSANDTRLSEFVVAPLASYNSAWGGDWTEVTDSESTPATGTLFDCEADFHLSFSFTHELGKYVYIETRYTDGDNNVRVGAASNNAWVLRNEVGGSLETVYGGGSVADGVSYKVDLHLSGSDYSFFVNNALVVSGTFSDDGNNSTTGGRALLNLATNDIELTTHPYPALGIATSRVIAPQTTDTYTHENDFVAEIKNITLPSSGDMDYQFRISGSDELTLRFNDDGSVTLLDNATPRITGGAATVSDADDIVLVCEGASGEVFVDGVSVGSTSAIAITTGTAGKRLDATDGVCDHIACFPRDVSSLLPSELV